MMLNHIFYKKKALGFDRYKRTIIFFFFLSKKSVVLKVNSFQPSFKRRFYYNGMNLIIDKLLTILIQEKVSGVFRQFFVSNKYCQIRFEHKLIL